MSAHFSDDFVWVVHTSFSSFNIPYASLKKYGISGIYVLQDDPKAYGKRNEIVNAGMKAGIMVRTYDGTPAQTAQLASEDLTRFAGNDGGQTAVLLDYEPSNRDFLTEFVGEWRKIRPGRVTDFTPEPFKGQYLPQQYLLDSRIYPRVQTYFGDMSPAQWDEAYEDYRVIFGNSVRLFIDGGRKTQLPIFYQGNIVRNLRPGTCIWNTNLMREAGLI